MSGNGNLYIAGMDEGGGGFPHNDTNLIYKSTDGGATWSNTYTGTPFPGPGVMFFGYFACMFSTTVPTGATRAGVSLLRSTISFTWSMPSTALAVTLATSFTFVPLTVV